MIRPLRILKAIIEYPIGERQVETDWNARLEADRQKRLASFEVQDFIRRREAALRGLGRAA